MRDTGNPSPCAASRPRSRARETPGSSGHQPGRRYPASAGRQPASPGHPGAPPPDRPPSAGPPRPGRVRHIRGARPSAERRGAGTAGARGCPGARREGGAGKGECLLVAARPPPPLPLPSPGKRSSLGPRARNRPRLPAGAQGIRAGSARRSDPCRSGSRLCPWSGGAAPAPIPLPDPFFPSPQAWGTRRPPRKAARWRAVSPGPGPGPSGRLGGQRALLRVGAPRPRAWSRPCSRDRSCWRGPWGPAAFLPSLPPPGAAGGLRALGRMEGGGRKEEEGSEGGEKSPRFPLLTRARGFTHSETLPQIWFGQRRPLYHPNLRLSPRTPFLGATGSAVGGIGSSPSITVATQPFHKVRGC